MANSEVIVDPETAKLLDYIANLDESEIDVYRVKEIVSRVGGNVESFRTFMTEMRLTEDPVANRILNLLRSRPGVRRGRRSST